MMLRALPVMLLLAACSSRPVSPAGRITGQAAITADQHVPDFARRPFEPFSRANVVGITLREWRGFGSVVDDDPPDDSHPLPRNLRPDKQPGLWQRVGEYWWLGQDAGSQESGWTSKYDEFGDVYRGDAPAWSAAFVSYVMRAAGARDRFLYSPLHADYINAAAQGTGALRTERPEAYAPQPGDLICMSRGGARSMRFEDLSGARFFGHCDVVVAVQPGQLTVVGGNVDGGVTMKHVPTTNAGMLSGEDGQVVDRRYNWFVSVRVLYDE
jgi:hypothetical protein